MFGASGFVAVRQCMTLYMVGWCEAQQISGALSAALEMQMVLPAVISLWDGFSQLAT